MFSISAIGPSARSSTISDGRPELWSVVIPPWTNTEGRSDLSLEGPAGRCGGCEAQPMRSASETMIPSGPRT